MHVINNLLFEDKHISNYFIFMKLKLSVNIASCAKKFVFRDWRALVMKNLHTYSVVLVELQRMLTFFRTSSASLYSIWMNDQFICPVCEPSPSSSWCCKVPCFVQISIARCLFERIHQKMMNQFTIIYWWVHSWIRTMPTQRIRSLAAKGFLVARTVYAAFGFQDLHSTHITLLYSICG